MQLNMQNNGTCEENQPDLTRPALYKKLHSEAAQDIISKKPGIIEQWGMPMIALILIMIFLATWAIKYPEIIKANAVLTAENAPKEIVTRQDGKLQRLFVLNEDVVSQGQPLGWIEGTADHGEVNLLSDLLRKSEKLLKINESERVSFLFSKSFHNLGELQSAYQQFVVAWQQFNDYLVNGYYVKRKLALFEDYSYLKKMHNTLELQLQYNRQDLDLSKEAYDANDSLYSQNIISRQDLRDQKSKLIAKQMNMPLITSSLLTNENLQSGKLNEIADLEHTISQQKITFMEACHLLKSAVDDWIRKYVITSPTAGKIVFSMPLQENQSLQAGKTIGFVNPSNSRYYAQVTLSQNNFGKIATGQTVQLRFDAYPYQEFGFVAGTLDYISNIPSDSGYLAVISLPEGLITNYKKKIQYHVGLKSQAFIITRDTRLMNRLLYSLMKDISVK